MKRRQLTTNLRCVHITEERRSHLQRFCFSNCNELPPLSVLSLEVIYLGIFLGIYVCGICPIQRPVVAQDNMRRKCIVLSMFQTR